VKELTYPEHGATRGDLPAGYRHVVRRVRIGSGAATFKRAADALFGWRMHRGAGMTLLAAPQVAVGAEVVTRLGPPVLGPKAPCRIVWVDNGARRQGFAYGTLPGHPESGEEAFLVEWANDDSVVFTILAFSRHAALWARLAGPIVRLGQNFVTERYVKALRRLASD
jgi:uncharacterized protein (UPF0548 family)